MDKRQVYAVGLTGGIGCGKTTVANQFAELGVAVIDTDEIARSLTAPGGAAMPAILAEFGLDFATADGALDRGKMRALAFSDPGARTRLETILHPMIRDATAAAAEAAVGPYLMYVVPLLLESGTWRGRVNRVLAIDCPEDLQVARVKARSGLDEAQVRAIMATQVTRQQRLAGADDVIVNDDGLEALAPQVTRLHAFYIAEATRMATIPMESL